MQINIAFILILIQYFSLWKSTRPRHRKYIFSNDHHRTNRNLSSTIKRRICQAPLYGLFHHGILAVGKLSEKPDDPNLALFRWHNSSLTRLRQSPSSSLDRLPLMSSGVNDFESAAWVMLIFRIERTGRLVSCDWHFFKV